MESRSLRCILVLLVLVAALATSGSTAVLRVDSGSQATEPDGSSWSLAYPTIEQAVSSAAPEDEIWVAAGYYDVPATDNSGFVVPAGVSLYGGFAGYESDRDTRDWRQNFTALVGLGSGGQIVTACGLSTAKTVVDGFVFQGEDIGVLCSVSDAVVAHNAFDPSVLTGVYCGGGAPTVAVNEFGGQDRAVWCEASHALIYGNVIDSCYTAGILAGWGDTSRISNNTITSCTGGIIIDGYGGIGNTAVANNIVTGYTNYGVRVDNGAIVTLSHNCVDNKWDDDWNSLAYVGPITVSPDNKAADPGLSSDGCHLLADSVCRDSGDNAYAAYWDTDMDGDARLFGLGIDIGADEYFRPGHSFVAIVAGIAGYTSDGDRTSEICHRLQQVHAYSPDTVTVGTITTDEIVNLPNTSCLESCYNAVIIAEPFRDLSSPQIEALYQFVSNCGRRKRVILVGEYPSSSIASWIDQNDRLNDIAYGLGMNTRFDLTPDRYFDNTAPSVPTQGHYLTDGVASVWGAGSGAFIIGQGTGVTELASIGPGLPWIVEEDTDAAGSRVAIHDADLLWAIDSASLTDPDHNLLFVYNLCTKFRP